MGETTSAPTLSILVMMSPTPPKTPVVVSSMLLMSSAVRYSE